jgi:hypothetical protein
MRIGTALIVFWSLIFTAAAQTPETYNYQILYTGRTLGYARIPDQQTLPATVGSGSVVATQFLNQIQSGGGGRGAEAADSHGR